MLERTVSSQHFFWMPKTQFNEIKENLPAQKAHIEMAYHWWAFDGPTLFGSYVDTLWH